MSRTGGRANTGGVPMVSTVAVRVGDAVRLRTISTHSLKMCMGRKMTLLLLLLLMVMVVGGV
jgi:hypothetical protein